MSPLTITEAGGLIGVIPQDQHTERTGRTSPSAFHRTELPMSKRSKRRCAATY